MGKKTTKTTSTSAPPSWALGPLTSGMNTITNTVQGNAGNLSNIESGLTGMLPGLQQQVADTRQQLQPGIGYINDTLGGKYLNSNPYTTAMAQQAGQDAGNSVNATFSRAGRTGGGADQMMLAKGVDQAENGVLFQNYQNERGLQSSAAGMLPGMTAAEGASVAPYLAASQLAGQLPYYGLAPLSGLGGLAGNYGTTTGTAPGGWGTALGGILGSGLAGWASGGFKGA